MSIAVITGATGQDGSYLVEYLLELGTYKEIRCAVRRTTRPLNKSNLSKVVDKVKVYECDLTDQSSLYQLFEGDGPYEVYNLAAQSQVGTSFKCPQASFEANTMGTLNLLEVIRKKELVDKVKFYQASTSEMFGRVQEVPQKETTPFYPRSPYGIAKLAAHWIVKNYRESYGMYACSGILFNHESPRRGEYFVTQKIAKGLKKDAVLELGNLEAMRDWGHAKDYVRAMWLMLQQPEPDDYVVSSGKQHSVREFVEAVADIRGIDIAWKGDEGIDVQTQKVIVRVSPEFYRPCEVDTLLGDSTKIQSLGWKPEYSFEQLVEDMVKAS